MAKAAAGHILLLCARNILFVVSFCLFQYIYLWCFVFHKFTIFVLSLRLDTNNNREYLTCSYVSHPCEVALNEFSIELAPVSFVRIIYSSYILLLRTKVLSNVYYSTSQCSLFYTYFILFGVVYASARENCISQICNHLAVVVAFLSFSLYLFS